MINFPLALIFLYYRETHIGSPSSHPISYSTMRADFSLICKHFDVCGLGSCTVLNYQQEVMVSRTSLYLISHYSSGSLICIHLKGERLLSKLHFLLLWGSLLFQDSRKALLLQTNPCTWLEKNGWKCEQKRPSSKIPDDLGMGEKEGERCKV